MKIFQYLSSFLDSNREIFMKIRRTTYRFRNYPHSILIRS